MKKFLLVLVVLSLGVTGVSASDTWSHPNRVTAQGGVGLYRTGLGEVQAGMDVALTQVELTPEFPLDLGVSGRLAVATAGVAAGFYGTTHYSWKALHTGLDWVNRLEVYLGIGIGLVPLVGLDAYGGIGFHFDPRWAVILEGAPFGGVLGVSYRF